MAIYPKAKDGRTDSRWGGQKFGKAMDGKVELEHGYAPVPLDSEAAAAARAVAALESGKSREVALARALAGADEVGTVGRILDEIEAEVVACRGVSPADYATVDSYTEALPVKHLDAAKWYAGLKAEYDVSTYADLRAACAPAVLEK